jgi:hypothetical protein
MFVILVDLHAAQDRVTEDGVGGHFFGQSNGDGSWAFVDLVGWVVGDDHGQTEATFALSVDAANCDGIKPFLCQ